MARIPVKGGNQPATHIKWSGGQKIVETGGGTNGGRVDVYENGRGRPDGPGSKDHYWATFDRQGNMTTSGRSVLARGARLAANTTINLPVAGPRAAAAATHAGGTATRAVRAKLQSSADRSRAAGRQWRHGAAHPIDQYRRERAKLGDTPSGSQTASNAASDTPPGPAP